MDGLFECLVPNELLVVIADCLIDAFFTCAADATIDSSELWQRYSTCWMFIRGISHELENLLLSWDRMVRLVVAKTRRLVQLTCTARKLLESPLTVLPSGLTFRRSQIEMLESISTFHRSDMEETTFTEFMRVVFRHRRSGYSTLIGILARTLLASGIRPSSVAIIRYATTPFEKELRALGVRFYSPGQFHDLVWTGWVSSSGFRFIDMDLTRQSGNDTKVELDRFGSEIMADITDHAKNGLVVRPHLISQ